MQAQAPMNVPAFACFGGCVFLDSSGVSVVHHIRSNVFPIYHFIRGFTATATEWQQLEVMVIAEAKKRLAAKGYNVTIQHPVLLSNYPDQQKTQQGLDIWNSRTAADIKIEIPSPVMSAFSER